MIGRLKEKLAEKKGFTLLEMIIVLGITAVLTGLVTAGIHGYLVSAYMTRANDTAKTVFLAAQNYLTQQKQLGKLEAFNKTAEAYGGGLSEEDLKEILVGNDGSFDFSAYKDKYSTNTVRYIRSGKGDGAGDNPIYTIVKNYTNDEKLLANTFLMEYDTRTGVVRAVFYTEKAADLSYSGSYTDKENVVLRDSGALRKKRQGYYGVTSTSLVKTDIDLYAPGNVLLVNGERLYAQWQESNYLSDEDIDNGYMQNANDAFDDAELKSFLVYDVEAYKSTEGAEDERLFSVSGISPAMAKGKTLAEADAAAGDGVILSWDEYSNTFRLLLDDIDHSIYDTYGQMEAENGTGAKAAADVSVTVDRKVQASDILYIKVTQRLAEHDVFSGESDSVSSNVQSVNFAGGADEYSFSGLDTDLTEVFGNGNLREDGSAAEYGKAFSIANARHLNNIRYAANTSCFIQTADIDWAKPETDRPEVSVFFEPLDFTAAQDSGPAELEENGEAAPDTGTTTPADAAFAGTYQNGYEDGDDFVISHLNIEKLSGDSPEKNVGMFRRNMGIIEGLHIEASTVRGAYLTGIVAGANSGEITGATLNNCTVEAVYYAGGITGYNYPSGILKDSTVAADVSGTLTADAVIQKEPPEEGAELEYGWYIGGAAGINQGEARNLVTGKGNVTGAACVGGLFGANLADDSHSVNKSVNRNSVKPLKENGITIDDYQNFGGIAGFNGEDSIIEYCTNETLVFFEKNASNPAYIQNIGGIAGRNRGTLAACRNVAGTAPAVTVKAVMEECLDGAQKGSFARYSGVNVGGIAGWNEKEGTVVACGSGNAVTGYRNVGGIAGKNTGALKEKDSVLGKWHSVSADDRKVTGVIAAADTFAGGIAGTNEQKELKGYRNEANIFAASLAGGITGANGGMGEYLFNRDKTDAGYHTMLSKPPFEKTDENSSISSCENFGFVYATERYAGGITGVNYGKILSSNSTVNLSDNEYLRDKLDGGYMDKIARADCVGGIAGVNAGRISGNSLAHFTTRAGVCGMDFAGGIAGLNTGIIENVQKVLGEVWSAGSCVGGIVGLNMNADSMKNITITDGMYVKGGYFVGGLIGMNATEDTENPQITGLVTQAEQRRGSVSGTAYVGGILGYNTTITAGEDLSGLFNGEIKTLSEQAFSDYVSKGGSVSAGKNATVFKDCINHSEVSADRYLGGIVGYNNGDSPLYIIKSINYGGVEVKNAGKTGDGFYFVGGITGRNSSGGVIHECVNDGSVKSPSTYLGGICEVNEGYIQFCTVGKSENYNSVGITGDNSVGGLVGLNSSYVVQCKTSEYAKINGGDNTGGIAGTNDEDGVITGDSAKARTIAGIIDVRSVKSEECISSGTVVGKDRTGGVAGLNQGQVELVSLNEKASISGGVYVGGLIGVNLGVITRSTGQREERVISGLTNRAGKVVGRDEVGGIVGMHNSTRIENCKNYGVVQIVTGSAGNAGGITGSVAPGITIEGCVNYGTVTGNDAGSHAGGITGDNKGTLKDCTHYGLAVSSDSAAGGITGINSGTVEECVNFGSVTGAVVADDDVAIGGIAGVNESAGTVKNCASRSNEETAKEDNPNKDTLNLIQGISTLGGIIGFNKGAIHNETPESRTVTVTIRTADQKVARPSNSSLCRIGGVIGRTEGEFDGALKDYTFAGTIEVTEKGASDKQSVGGIVGEIEGKGTVLDNCMLTGRIKGFGNGSDTGTEGGVGGLAGVSRGTIVVYPDKNGVYTSNTADSLVEGKRNVGGLVGTTETGHTLKIKTGSGAEAVKLEELSVNTNTDTSDDIYYTNLAAVSGGRRVGGCYGFLYHYGDSDGKGGRDTAVISHYQNGYLKSDGSVAGGNIRPNGAVATERQAIGGVIGSTRETNVFYQAFSLRNYGTVGSGGLDEYESKKTVNVGGIFGYCGGSRGIRMENVINYGKISCGQEYIGGVAGKIEQVINASNSETELVNCYNRAKIVTKGNYTGGLVGGAYRINLSRCRNEGNIEAHGNAAFLGGILGGAFKPSGTGSAWTPAVRITECWNQGRIATDRDGLLQDGRVGGIAGYAAGTTSIISCVNNGEMHCTDSGKVGGIAGFVEGSESVIENCENNGVLSAAAQDTGGIAGQIGGVNKLTFRLNDNSADICAKYRAGGIIGKLEATAASSAGWIMEECVNSGNLYPTLSGKSSNASLHEQGGCIGYLKSRVTVKNFSNSGNLTVIENRSNRAVGQVLDLGGIVGVAAGVMGNDSNTDSPSLTGCVNTGRISVGGGNSFTLDRIGGIAGHVATDKTKVMLLSCTNSQAIDLSGYTKKSVNHVGGIAGKVDADGKLQYCVNEADVLTAAGNGTNIGGVAGECRGLIYSCSTQGSGLIQGREAVGGIVGYANGITCKVTSLVNEEMTDLSVVSNTFDVKAEKMAGGIAGRQNCATIMSAVNRDNRISLTGTQGSRENCAGGIVGLSEKPGGEQGVVVNCYNFGDVSFDKSVASRYLGGVIGYREPGNGGKTASSVKDSYYLRADESKPDDKPKQRLAIGNEPEDHYTTDDGDMMSGMEDKKETPARFYWTEDAYKALYSQVHGSSPAQTAGWDDPATVMENIIKRYDKYKLPVPETGAVTAQDGFDYMLEVKKMPGFCDSVSLYLYDESVSDEEIKNKPDGLQLLGPVTEKVEMDHQIKSIGFQTAGLADYIGKPVKVAIEASGVSKELVDGTEVVYTTDSDRIVVYEFILMPPLVTPEIEMQSQDGPVVTFKIVNWEQYQKSAAQIYDAIADNPELRNKEIYRKLLNGLQSFSIDDYYREKKDGTARDVKDVWEISQDMINQEDGTFTIDYAQSGKFDSYRSKRQYHFWEVKAAALHSDWSLEKQAVTDQNLYRYTSSLIGECDFRIQAEAPLNPPTDLKAAYTGGLDSINEEETPGYELTFERSTSPEEAIAHYLITVTNPENGRTHTAEYVPEPAEEGTEGGDEEPVIPPCSYILPKDILTGKLDNQLDVDLTPDSLPVKLDFKIQAIKNDSDAAKYFLNSAEAAGTAALIKKGYPVDDGITITIENDSEPNLWIYKWTDDEHGTGADTYIVMLRITDGENVLIDITEETGSRKYYQLDTGGYAATSKIELSVVRKGVKNGEKVTRLNSDPVTHSKLIGDKLPDVENVTTVFDRIDGEDLIYLVDFDLPAEGLKEDNCKGFTLAQVTNDNPAQQLGEKLTIPFDQARPVEVRVPLADNKGKMFYTIVTALSGQDNSANSDGKQGATVKIPEQQLAPPEDIKAAATGYAYELTEKPADGVYSFLKDEFAGMSYEISWTLADSANIRQQKLILLAPEEDPAADRAVLWEKTTDLVQTKESFQVDLGSYAGKTLTLKITNLPTESALMLPSEEKEITLYVPKNRLQEPEAVKSEAQRADGAPALPEDEIPEADYDSLSYNLSWTKPDNEGKETGVKIRLVSVTETDSGETLETPAEFEAVTKDGMLKADKDGTVLLPWKETEDASDKTAGKAILKNIPKELAGGKMKVYVSHVTGKWEPDIEPDEEWADSDEAETGFTMPKLKKTAVSSSPKHEEPEETTAAETEDGSETETETEAEAETGTESGTETETKTETGSDTEAGTVTESETEAGGGTGTDASVKEEEASAAKAGEKEKEKEESKITK